MQKNVSLLIPECHGREGEKGPHSCSLLISWSPTSPILLTSVISACPTGNVVASGWQSKPCNMRLWSW